MKASYRCSGCGNKIAAWKVDRREQGSEAMISVVPTFVVCDCGYEMQRKEVE